MQYYRKYKNDKQQIVLSIWFFEFAFPVLSFHMVSIYFEYLMLERPKLYRGYLFLLLWTVQNLTIRLHPTTWWTVSIRILNSIPNRCGVGGAPGPVPPYGDTGGVDITEMHERENTGHAIPWSSFCNTRRKRDILHRAGGVIAVRHLATPRW